MRSHRRFYLPAILLGLAFSAGCGVQAGFGSDPQPTATFEFFRTDTPIPSITPTLPGTATPLPSPSPTPRTHTIMRGDTFSGIAFQFGVSIPALQAANPGLDPNILMVGTVVFIPPPGTPASGTPEIPTPTPVSLQLTNPACHRSGDGGLWCFVEVANPQSFPVESVSGSIRLAGADGIVHSQDTALILNVLPPGGSLPLAAYFPSPVPEPVQIDAGVNMVLPLNDPGARYAGTTVENLIVTIAPGGRSAEVSGEVALAGENAQAAAVWVALAAYDAQGNPTGIRRWESGQALKAGERLPFRFMVYAAGGPIAQVKALAEARR